MPARLLPNDGSPFGRLKVRGPSIARAYFKEGSEALDDEGFFDTGDVGTLDACGYLNITDRSKDVIKSGGEWISSIELENIAVGHPQVAEAAVIGVRHPKWDERPLLVIVRKAGQDAAARRCSLISTARSPNGGCRTTSCSSTEIPHTATGKIQKTVLREQFKNHVLPSAAA